MFAIDDRTGNAVTTVALFLIVAGVLYRARGAFFVLLLSLLFAYLLEPAVMFVQRHLHQGKDNRTWAIAVVYLIGTLVAAVSGYKFGPYVVTEIKSLNAALPQILQDFSSGKAASDLGTRHGLSAVDQQRIHDLLTQNHDFIARALGRVAGSAAYVATSAAWLFAIPILAIFILRDGRQLANSVGDALGLRQNQTGLKRILGRIDTMLARYIRAQLTLAALSFVFYTVSTLILGFPYAIALGVLGGALEFLPAVGWTASAAVILTIGFLTHAHWIWMAGLLVLWRLVQDYVNSPHIMGDKLELQPLTVIFALMVGGQLGGIAGLYLSVPAVAVLRIVWLESLSTRNSVTSLSKMRPTTQTPSRSQPKATEESSEVQSTLENVSFICD